MENFDSITDELHYTGLYIKQLVAVQLDISIALDTIADKLDKIIDNKL